MTEIAIDGLIFTFPASWTASKYDNWSFYRNQFGKMSDGIKAVDLVALDDQRCAWFVEVKDYRANMRSKPTDLAEEVFRKVFDTLAALLPALANANDATEQHVARTLLGATRLRVVLHLEQPTKHSRLRPRAINPLDVTQKLRRLLRAVDPHPYVAETSQMGSLEWNVRSL